MRNYEIMYIVKASLEEAARQELVTSLHAIITNDGGVVKHVDEWDFANLRTQSMI